MECGGCADACAKDYNWPVRCLAFQFIECCECRRSDPRKPRWSGAPTEPGVIHSPDFNRTIIPHFGLGGRPAIRPIGISVKAQNVNVCSAFLLRESRLCRPHLQLTILEWQHFSNGAVSVNRGGRREKNQMIRQMTEEHHSQI
jgi:hypothetical protein